MILDHLEVPIVLAPLGGGPSTPELAAEVANAGGLGFLAAGYLSGEELKVRIDRTLALSNGLIGVNVFVPGAGPTEPAAYARYLERLRRFADEQRVEVGEPRYSDDEWDGKVELLLQERPPVVSFTFGCPNRSLVERFRGVGSEVWVTVTAPEEARVAAEAGVDVLVVQGGEAGGHRASFRDEPALPVYGLLPLLSLVREEVELPLVASGGISTGRAVAAVLCAGARAAQIGTAFMLCPEAGTAEVHRAAMRGHETTALTRAFTGRLARGIRNGFLTELSDDAPIAYPELHYVTAPMRRRGREEGNADRVNLWAGEAYPLAREAPAKEVIERLGIEAREALQEAGARLPFASGGRTPPQLRGRSVESGLDP
jgi:nitronate monooxygenase